MINQKNKEDRSMLIQTCINRSKYIIESQAAKLVARELKFFLNRLPISFSTYFNQEGLENDINLRLIDEYKHSIAKLLKPLLSAIGIEADNLDSFWFSSKDLQNGYVFLYNEVSKEPSHVLFLNSVEDAFYINILAGEIRNYNEVSMLLNKVKGVIDGSDIIYRYSMKKLKNRNNEKFTKR